jgi:type I restriction enzyme S subunit
MVGSDPRIVNSAVGQIAIIPSEMAGSVPNQNIVKLQESSNDVVKKYLFYILCSTSYRYHLDVFSHKLANQSIISSSHIANAEFTFPSQLEQQVIIDYLDTKLTKIDNLISKSTQGIVLLKEKRTALISAAVTGKIDVRDAA